jgi:hypothetical protein
MSLVKSTSISVDEGEETCKTIKPFIDCVCVCQPASHSEGKWTRQNIEVPFERGMVVDARRTGLSASRTAMLLGFSHSTVSRVCQEWSTTQRTSSQLDTTVGSIAVNMGPVKRFQQFVENLRLF